MRTLQNSLKTGSATVILFLIGLLTSARAWAQDKAIDINVDTDGGGGAWYGHWWVWVVGIALFVIILVAIVSASKKT
jgi:hypothetical protein